MKKKASSADMAGENQDKGKVDPKNIIDAKYGDVPEDQRKNLEACIRDYSEDIKRRMAVCYGKTQQGVVEKEKFVMPTLSSTTSSTSTTSNVSPTLPDILGQFVDALGKHLDESQQLVHNLLLRIDERLQTLDKGKRAVDHTYSSQTLNANSSTASTSAPLYGMPLNYFAVLTPPPNTIRPSTAEPVRLAAPAGQTGVGAVGVVGPVQQTGAMVPSPATPTLLASIPPSVAPSQTNELAEFVPPYTAKSYGEPPFPQALPQDVWDDLIKRNPVPAT